MKKVEAVARFEDKLVLSRRMLVQFGAETLEALGSTLSADHLIGFDEENSRVLRAATGMVFPVTTRRSPSCWRERLVSSRQIQ